jgi:hypothetical protein
MDTPNNETPPDSLSRSDPRSIVGALLSETESRRNQEAEARRIDAERARAMSAQQVLRERLADAFHLAYRFPGEETQQARKPPGSFQRWAERFLALGAVLRECDAAIDGLGLVERLHGVAKRPAPGPMKFACALLLIACDGQADAVASALENANSDGELRRFVLWLPFILDSLWHPFPEKNGLLQVAMTPDGTSWEENAQAERAFGWQPLGVPAEPPAPPSLDTPDKILSCCEAVREQLAEFARTGARGIRMDTLFISMGVASGQDRVYSLPTLEPIWNAAHALNLGDVPPWPGEPQTGPEAFKLLEAMAKWCRLRIAERACDPARTPPPPEDGPRVVLRGRNQGPIVLAKEKQKLTLAQYNVVKTLLDAGEVGLTKDTLVEKSRHTDARGVLARLADTDDDWKAVIHFAGEPGGGYRIG